MATGTPKSKLLTVNSLPVTSVILPGTGTNERDAPPIRLEESPRTSIAILVSPAGGRTFCSCRPRCLFATSCKRRAGADGGRRGGEEGGKDGGAKGGNDGGADGGKEGGVEGGSDGGADGGKEGGVEGGNDGGADGGKEGGVEGGSDGGADGGEDGEGGL